MLSECVSMRTDYVNMHKFYCQTGICNKEFVSACLQREATLYEKWSSKLSLNAGGDR